MSEDARFQMVDFLDFPNKTNVVVGMRKSREKSPPGLRESKQLPAAGTTDVCTYLPSSSEVKPGLRKTLTSDDPVPFA